MAGKTVKELSAEVTDMDYDATLNIYQRMLKAQSLIKTVSKNLEVDAGSRKYTAVSERDVLDAVKKAESDCGIYSYPHKRNQYEVKTTENKNGYESQWIRLEVIYRFVNVDNPTEYIDVQTYGDGVDAMDKAPGKAMTYADKYALMKAYKISTGDDPDKDASVDQKTTVQSQKPVQKPKKTMDELAVEWQTCRNKLVDLDIDIRSEKNMQWIANRTGYSDQELDFADPIKAEKTIEAYHTLIKGKEAKILKQQNEKKI